VATDPTAPVPLGNSLRQEAGDLIFDGANRSLAVVEDLAALAQALRLAIETQLGSDALNAGFGFDRLSVGVYAYGLQTRKEYVKMQLVRTVTRDRRVKDIREIFFSDDPRFFELRGPLSPEAQAEAIRQVRASRDYTVFVVVDTHGGDQIVVDAGGTLG
jgi:hypothetical protein